MSGSAEASIITKSLLIVEQGLKQSTRTPKTYTVEGEVLTMNEVKQFILDRMEYSSMSLRKIVLKYSGLHVPASLSKQNSFSQASVDTLGNIL